MKFAHLSNPSSMSIIQRIGWVLAGVALYALLVISLHEFMSGAVLAFSLLPAIVAGWVLGFRGGIMVGLLIFPLNAILFAFVQHPDLQEVITRGAASHIVLVIVGAMSGWVSALFEEVQIQSRQDSLTRVYNHGFFLTCVSELMETARASNRMLALIMIDVDNFKQYNDNFGHLIGDQVLVELASSMRKHVKPTDIVGCWGGEEFGIILPNISGIHATDVAKRISAALDSVAFTSRDGEQIPAPTICQGIAVFPDEENELEALIHLADTRLYIAKERGRNRIEPPISHWDAKNFSKH
ncbi:MAG: GGDEF domain-containing protein [Chloroflexi bacterium]|nr:GGDEF domain-containing protein [Chloroflexota bacterium]